MVGRKRRFFLLLRPLYVLFPTILFASWIALQHHLVDIALSFDSSYGGSYSKSLVTPEALYDSHYHYFERDANSHLPLSSSIPKQRPTDATSNSIGVVSQQLVQDQNLVYSLLHQSLCDSESSFLKLDNTWTTIQTWAVRLVYLSLYEHQNDLVLASHDDNASSSSLLLDNGLDCTRPQTRNITKFLVFAYGKSGLGANMRLGAVPALMLGLATDRRVVNINNADHGPKFLQEPWPWGSCALRNAECYFRPLTTLCWDRNRLDGAPILTKAEARYAFRTGRMPEAYEHEPLLILHVTFRPQRDPMTLRSVVSNKAHAIAHRFNWSDSWAVRNALHLLSAQPTVNDGEYDYYGVNSVIFHGLLLYAMRPNDAISSELKIILVDVTKQFDEATVGVPIRGKVSFIVQRNRDNLLLGISHNASVASDKCETESQCLDTRQYVSAALESRPFASSIFVTTEAKEVDEEMTKLARDNSTLLRIFKNKHDVLSDTGFLAEPSGHPNIVTTALSSIQAQLRTSFVIGNCCSNFHLVIKDLLTAGCGRGEHFQCLQRHANHHYRICCSWDRHCQVQGNKSQPLVTSRTGFIERKSRHNDA